MGGSWAVRGKGSYCIVLSLVKTGQNWFILGTEVPGRVRVTPLLWPLSYCQTLVTLIVTLPL